MLSQACMHEFKTQWLPNMTGAAMDRLIDLLEKNSPLLVHGSFTQTMPMGCLASHIGWNHPETTHLNYDAGVVWLNRVVGINSSASQVVRAWDGNCQFDWPIRAELLAALREYQSNRNVLPEQEEIAEDAGAVLCH